MCPLTHGERFLLMMEMDAPVSSSISRGQPSTVIERMIGLDLEITENKEYDDDESVDNDRVDVDDSESKVPLTVLAQSDLMPWGNAVWELSVVQI